MNWSSVVCSEVAGTRREGADIEAGFSASVNVHVAWSLRGALIADVIGSSYPDWSGSNAPICVSVSCSPLSPPESGTTVGQTIQPGMAVCTLNYSTKIQDLISEVIEPTVDFQVLDHTRFRWGAADGDPVLEGEAPGMQMRSCNLQRTLYQVTSMPAAVLSAIGYVNNGAYSSALLGGLTFPTETLLYNPPSLQRTIKSTGDPSWTVSMKFSYRPQTWNKYFRAKTQAWERFYLDSGGIYRSYPLGDFSSLLF